jgi:hypothetical protein
MWNEYMEWVDEWDNPIPIQDWDEDEDEDEDEDKEESTPGDKAIGLIAAAAALPIGIAGWAFGNYVVAPLIKKMTKKNELIAETEWERAKNKHKERTNASKENETTEWIRANIKDQK